MRHKNIIFFDLLLAQELAYEPNNLLCREINYEIESREYAACTFRINDKIIAFRIAKTTPIKIGQFVTLWKRIGIEPIIPYDASDNIDFFVISVRKNQWLGQFIFPKNILEIKGFISKNKKGGKRAMRVYPPWDIAESLQAKKTQTWQLLYFVEIQPDTDFSKIKKLFHV